MMRAAILLECDVCGDRFAFPCFDRGDVEGVTASVNELLFPLILGPPTQRCPTCDPGTAARGRRADYAVIIEDERRRARGEVFLDGRPKAVAS